MIRPAASPVFLRLLALLGLIALLSGCDARPVFDSDPPDPRLESPAIRAVVVRPVTAAPTPQGFAEMMAEALREQGVPATAQGEIDGALVLEAVAKTEAESLVLRWTLTDDGAAIGDHAQDFPLQDWFAADPTQAAALAGAAAPALAALLRPPSAAPPPATLRTGIGTIDAPGDGPKALRAALIGHLSIRGVALAASATEADLVVHGLVRTTATGDGRDIVAILWRVTEPGGGEVGSVRQSNVVPAGRLSRTWGPLAGEVAAAAADGLVQLLRPARENGAAR